MEIDESEEVHWFLARSLMGKLRDLRSGYSLDFAAVAGGYLASEENNNKTVLGRVFAGRALGRKTLMAVLFITAARRGVAAAHARHSRGIRLFTML